MSKPHKRHHQEILVKKRAQIKKELGKFQTNTTIPEMGFDRHCVKPLSLRSKIN